MKSIFVCLFFCTASPALGDVVVGAGAHVDAGYVGGFKGGMTLFAGGGNKESAVGVLVSHDAMLGGYRLSQLGVGFAGSMHLGYAIGGISYACIWLASTGCSHHGLVITLPANLMRFQVGFFVAKNEGFEGTGTLPAWKVVPLIAVGVAVAGLADL